MLFGTEFLLFAALLDLSFNLLLFLATLLPVVKVKQWKQMGIISKVLLIGLCNLSFYLGYFNVLELGVHWGIYGGIFIIIALVLTMGRRVMPFFIEKGVGYPVQLKQSRFLDISSLVLFLGLCISELFIFDIYLSSWLAAALLIISAVRMRNWHTHGIWRVPLLWGLYVAFIFISLGFLFYALVPYSASITRSLALHAMAFGGIGIITLSMMSRVTLGHTGRDINQPSKWINVAQWLLVIGTLVRLFPGILMPDQYSIWILISQLMWIAGFAIFSAVNLPLLTRPRVDGSPG